MQPWLECMSEGSFPAIGIRAVSLAIHRSLHQAGPPQKGARIAPVPARYLVMKSGVFHETD